MTHGAVAKRVRLNKEAHPENFCIAVGCLWRTNGATTWCPRHRPPEAYIRAVFNVGPGLPDKEYEAGPIIGVGRNELAEVKENDG